MEGSGEHEVPGFQELLVIGVVAFFVIGPERLPELAANVARLIARSRREARSAVGALEERAGADAFTDDLRLLHGELRDSGTVAKRALRNELRALTGTLPDQRPTTSPNTEE